MSDVTSEFKDSLEKKLGPLKGWQWVVIIGSGAVIGYFIWGRVSGNSSSTTTTDDTDTDTTDTDGADYGTATTGATSAVNVDSTQTAQSDDTNQAWINKAVPSIATSMRASQSVVEAALTNYCNGDNITAQDQKYVDAAIATYGAPPEGIQGVSKVTDSEDVLARQAAEAKATAAQQAMTTAKAATTTSNINLWNTQIKLWKKQDTDWTKTLNSDNAKYKKMTAKQKKASAGKALAKKIATLKSEIAANKKKIAANETKIKNAGGKVTA